MIFAGISDAYYCAECTRLEKDRDGCPNIVNLGASRTDLSYERRRLGMLYIRLPFGCANSMGRIQERIGHQTTILNSCFDKSVDCA